MRRTEFWQKGKYLLNEYDRDTNIVIIFPEVTAQVLRGDEIFKEEK